MKKLIVIEAILFLVAGIITVFVGEFTVDNYGTILLLCGVVALAISVISQTGSRHRPMPYSYRPKIFVSEQHLRDKKGYAHGGPYKPEKPFFFYLSCHNSTFRIRDLRR